MASDHLGDLALRLCGLDRVRRPKDRHALYEGRRYHPVPRSAATMVGIRRLENVRTALETVTAEGIPGDFIEAGVWRGGVGIYARAVLDSLGEKARRIVLADSFEGLPPPDPSNPKDVDLGLHLDPRLAASQKKVRRNFRRFGIATDRVDFIEGFFQETLPQIPRERQFAVIRLDGDMYASTKVALEALYPLLAPGGFLIVDDHGAIPACAQAVGDFRDEHGVDDPIIQIDWTGVYWRKGVAARGTPVNDRSSIIAAFHRLYYDCPETWLKNRWLGTHVQKNPLDLWQYQELIHDLRPQLIVETGSFDGGSALFMAHIADLLDIDLDILTIDIDGRPRPKHPRITYLEADSADPSTIAKVRRLAAGRRTLVILDSDHTQEHVLREMEGFADIVEPGSYMIVEDTNINGHPVLPEFGPGPAEAVERFLAKYDGWTVDRSQERQLMTFNPGGSLRRDA